MRTRYRSLVVAALLPLALTFVGCNLVRAKAAFKDGNRLYKAETYRKAIVALGVQAATASTNLTTQSAVSTQVDASRESTSGVNIDEEMTSMLQYQHGYAAAGKLVSVINDMLDTVINMVG